MSVIVCTAISNITHQFNMKSEIKSFYSNTNVLITGATGLFGKMLIYKLLNTCVDINGIYLIMREKKGKTITERLEEIFKEVIFDEMKKENSEFSNKIHIIVGDCSQFGLGLNPTHRKLLIDKIHIVFHCAASLNMNAKMKCAVETNVRGLSELIDLCHEMRYLKSMVFVSTAYSHCTQSVIEEKFYETPIKATTLVKLTDEVDEQVLDNMTTGLIGNWPNTYCFTKAVAENMCYNKAGNLPVGIFRPTIVMPTYSDPVPGWTSNVYGVVGVMLLAGMGVLRVFFAEAHYKFDVVPADFCINALICSAREIQQKRSTSERKTVNGPTEQQIPVYNYSGGPRRNITWRHLMTYSDGYELPSKDAIWATAITLTANKLYYNFLWLFLHIIPGYLMDMYLILTGKKPMLIKAYKKISKFQDVLRFFTTREWDIINKNVDNLWNKLNETDKTLFPFDMDVMDYKKYILNTCSGIKIYINKEGLNNIKAEKKRYQRLVFLHKTVKTVFRLVVVVVVYKSVICFSTFMRNSIF